MTIKKILQNNISNLKTNMEEEASLDFRLRQIDEARNYLSDEINCNNLMIEEYKKTCKYINCVEHLLILVSAMTGCVSISVLSLCRYYKFWSRNRNLCNHSRNQKV